MVDGLTVSIVLAATSGPSVKNSALAPEEPLQGGIYEHKVPTRARRNDVSAGLPLQVKHLGDSYSGICVKRCSFGIGICRFESGGSGVKPLRLDFSVEIYRGWVICVAPDCCGGFICSFRLI